MEVGGGEGGRARVPLTPLSVPLPGCSVQLTPYLWQCGSWRGARLCPTPRPCSAAWPRASPLPRSRLRSRSTRSSTCCRSMLPAPASPLSEVGGGGTQGECPTAPLQGRGDAQQCSCCHWTQGHILCLCWLPWAFTCPGPAPLIKAPCAFFLTNKKVFLTVSGGSICLFPSPWDHVAPLGLALPGPQMTLELQFPAWS